MLDTLLKIVAPAIILLAIGGFIYVHWRHHIHSTPLDSFPALQKRLRGGRPVLLQFHAPL